MFIINQIMHLLFKQITYHLIQLNIINVQIMLKLLNFIYL